MVRSTLQGLILKSQLSDCAVDLLKEAAKRDPKLTEGALKTAADIHKTDVLSLLIDTDPRFSFLLNAKQLDSKLLRALRRVLMLLFPDAVQHNPAMTFVPRYSSLCFRLIFLIESAQQNSVLSTAVPVGKSASQTALSCTGDQVLQMIKYEQIASVCHATDQPEQPSKDDRTLTTLNSFGSASQTHSSRNRPKSKLTAKQIADLKCNNICRRCKKKR